MTSQDFGSLLSLVNTDALTSYDVDLEKRTCSRCPWQVTGRDPVCTRPNGFEIEKTSKNFAMNISIWKTLGQRTGNFFINSLTWIKE